MGEKRKRSKKDKKKRKKRKVESSSSSDSSDSSSSDSDSESVRETLRKIMCKLVDLSREMDSPLTALRGMFEKLNAGKKVSLKHMAHKPTKKLLTKLFFSADLKEKKRAVWQIRQSSPDFLPILDECIPNKINTDDATKLIHMLITEDSETASKMLLDVLKSIDESKCCTIPDECEPVHFWEFAELLFEYLLMEKQGDDWLVTRSTPPNLRKLFKQVLKPLTKAARKPVETSDESFGCALPPGFVKRKMEVHQAQENIGPAMPTDNNNDNSELKGGERSEHVVGPAVPTAAQIILAQQMQDAESSDDDDYGPANLEDGESMTKKDKRRAMRMMQFKELHEVEERYKLMSQSSSANREEWMSMPSGDMGDMFGKKAHNQRSRGFSTKKVDKSAWSMTEQQRNLQKQKNAEIDAINAKYGTVKPKEIEEKEEMKEFQAPKQQSMMNAHLSNVSARVVSWEVRQRRGGRVGPRPGSEKAMERIHENIVPQNFVDGGSFR